MNFNMQNVQDYNENGIFVWIVNEVDAVAARSIREAVEWYENFSGLKQETGEVLPDEEIVCQDLSNMMFIDEDRDRKDTVRSQIKEMIRIPHLIWSTEY